MARDFIQTSTSSSATTGLGPYRRRPPADPALRARLNEALDAARSEMRSARHAHRWLTGLAASGYIAAALLASLLSDDGAGARQAIIWPPMAAGATCALVRAGRAGARNQDLQAELADLERLSDSLGRTPD